MAKTRTSFKKGQEGLGRPKGTPNEKTRAWEALGDFLTDVGAEKAKEIMMSAPPEKFMFYYTMFIEYFKPKRSREDGHGNPENKIVINVNAPNEI